MLMRDVIRTLAILPFLIALLAAIPAKADDLDVDLSKPDVRLDVSFEGSELLLFGAKDLLGDVIVVVRGPEKDTSIRLQERVAGIWVSTDEVIYEARVILRPGRKPPGRRALERRRVGC